MLKKFLTNLSPTSYEGAAHKETVEAIERPLECPAPAFNLCRYQASYSELAFSETGVIQDAHKNDTTPILMTKVITTDTLVLELFKRVAGAEVLIDLIDDDTLGIYLDETNFPDGLHASFVADWNLIFNAHGYGKYFFKITKTIIAQVTTEQSWDYLLQEFDEEKAHGTVVIKAEHNEFGIIEGGIDYTGFGFTYRLRVHGTFGNFSPTITKDHYQTQDRIDRQNRDKIDTTYQLITELIPYEVIRPFMYDRLLANNIDIMSYDLFGHLPTFCFFSVTPDEIEESKFFAHNTNGVFSFLFSDKVKKPIKTSFQ